MTSKTSISLILTQSTHQEVKHVKKRNKNVKGRQENEIRDNLQIGHLSFNFTKTNNTLIKGFVIFSKTHDNFNLKINTLFLAFEIYARIYNKSQLNEINISYLQCISLYLAMKYEEIYHPYLKHLEKELGMRIDLVTYKKHQFKVLKILNFNLDLSLISREMDQEMGQSNSIQNMIALYLLQICMVTSQIYLKFPRQQLVKGVTILAKRKQTYMINSELSLLCKLILLAKTSILKIQSSIYYKYMQSKYDCVSTIPL